MSNSKPHVTNVILTRSINNGNQSTFYKPERQEGW